MRLRAGLTVMNGLRAGELATAISDARRYGVIDVKRLSDGKEIVGNIKAADLVHGFDGWLPVAAAFALEASNDAAMVLVEAAPDAVGADGRTSASRPPEGAPSVASASRWIACALRSR